MWFINKKINLLRSRVLQGMVDIHSHLLWGVDDGAKDINQTQQIIAAMRELGITSAFATSHIMSGLPGNTPQKLVEVFKNDLSPLANNLDFEVRLAAEYMLDEAFMQKFRQGNLLIYDGKHLLVEISTMAIPVNLEETIFEICSSGYIPIMAHPERYTFQNITKYERLADMGCKYQLNILSLSDHYGKHVRTRAEALLDAGMYDFIGTDAHSAAMLKKAGEINLSKDRTLQIKQLVSNNSLLAIIGEDLKK